MMVATTIVRTIGTIKANAIGQTTSEPVRTGNVDYDDYFEDVSSFRASSRGASDDDKKARAPAAQALGVSDPSVPM